MASIQKSINAYKTIHRDYQQLDNVKTILIDCTQHLNDILKSHREIAKLTKLSLEVLDVVSEETQAGLKTLAPSHSFANLMKSNEAEKRHELAKETGFVTAEKDPEKNLQGFLKRRKRLARKNAPATNNGSSVVSPSPKKARRSKWQKLIQNDQHHYAPANGKLFSPIELYNILTPLDAALRMPLVSHFIEKDWSHYKGQDPGRCVC